MRRIALIAVVFSLLVAACGDDDAGVIGSDDLTDVVFDLTDDEIDLLLEAVSDAEYDEALDALDAGDVETFLAYADPELLAELLGVDPTPTSSPSTSPTATSPAGTSGTIASADDIRFVDGGSGDDIHDVTVPVASGDISLLAWARSAGQRDEVWITAVVAPSGRDVLADLGLNDGTYSNFGEAAIVLPLDPDAELEAGTWTVRFESDGETVDSGAIVRRGDPDAPAVIDVTVWLVTDDAYSTGELGAALRGTGERVFAGSGIGIGALHVVQAPDDIVRRFGDIPVAEDDPAEIPQKDLCRAMSSTFTDRTLLVAVVDRIVDDDPEGTIEGNASGLPGTVLIPDSGISCVIVMGDADPGEPDRGLFERTIVLWHEVGHHLGLFHTTEATGDTFDILADTPECDLDTFDEGDGWADAFECPDGTNFMFHDTDETELSADQAAAIRRHPLLRPGG